MIAVHFGAGNIGRGFIGSLLYQSGFTTYFVDVNQEIVEALNREEQYRVVLAAEVSEELWVQRVRAVNSRLHPEQVQDLIAKADLVTTAIGPNILPLIADLLADGLRHRLAVNPDPDPLNIIACENMIGGSAFLQEKVYEKLQEEEKARFDQYFAFPNAAVDRIVPLQTNDDPLLVQVEPFFEWVVEQKQMVGKELDIVGMKLVDDLPPYIERKLFTVNTGHAVTAYLGYAAGIGTIAEAMQQDGIRTQVEQVLQETGRLLVEKYSFDAEEHQGYIEKIMSRFLNPFISDEVTRVGRSPLRKLGPHDRLVQPARQYVELFQEMPEQLAAGIAAALHYDYAGDEEAVALQETIKDHGVEAAIEQYTGLELGNELVELIVRFYQSRAQ